jgi:hypothetical protein
VRKGLGFLRREFPSILVTRTDVLSPRIMRIIEELAEDWRRLATHGRTIHWVTDSLREYVGITAAVPQIAADLPHCPSRQGRAWSRTDWSTVLSRIVTVQPQLA